MALFQIHRGLKGISPERTPTLRGVATVILGLAAIPGGAFAQTADTPLPGGGAQNCEPHSTERAIQMAMVSPAKLEPGAGPVGGSKAAAILGGAPSKLEQMRMAQVSGEIQTLAMEPAAAPVSDAPINCAANIAAAPPVFATAPAMSVPENAILGTLSLSVKHTPFDRDWAAVSAKQNTRKMQRALAATGARKSGDQAAQIEAVNRWVNRKISYGEDREVYGRADYWAPAGETLRRGVGDCEDFAIAKLELLAALGVSRNKMRLVVARDLVRNADHAVLIVTLTDGSVMLDNMTDRLLDARMPNDYRPIMSFSSNAKWVHGYAVQPAVPARMAAATITPATATTDDVVMTVTQEPQMPAVAIALLSAPLALPISL